MNASNDKNIPKDEFAFARQLADQALRTAAANAAFAKMTPAEQRVTIAKDVLEWMASGRLEAVEPGETYLHESRNIPYTVDSEQCIACGVGALLACTTARDIDVRVPVGILDGMICRIALEKYFESNQLHMIEAAFEGLNRRLGSWPDTDDLEVSLDFAEAGKNPPDRMRRIMRNIIRNKGTFKP